MLTPGIADDSTINEALAYHMLGWSQRDVATAIGMSQRYVCYLLKRLGLKPNGYHTAASLGKRSQAMAETAKRNQALRSQSAVTVARLRRVRGAVETPWEASWPLVLGRLPPRLGYPTFAALSRHGLVGHGEAGIQILPRGKSLLIRGTEERLSQLVDAMPEHTPFCVGSRVCVLGVPRIRAAKAVNTLSSWCVTAKGKETLESFAEWCHRDLDRIGVTALPNIGDRRAIKIKDTIIVGYQVSFSRLNERESLRLQAVGLGGRRRFGCGVFI